MIATIEERIESATKETESVTPLIEMGSDAYLDIVLYFKEKLESFTSNLSMLNENIIASFNQQPQEIYDLLPKIRILHLSSLQAIKKLKQSPYSKGLDATISNMTIEVKQLREVIDDVKTIHVSIKKDDYLQSLFSQI